MLIAPSPEKAAVTGKHSGESGCLPPTPGTVKKKSEEIKFAKLKRHKGSPLPKPGIFNLEKQAALVFAWFGLCVYYCFLSRSQVLPRVKLYFLLCNCCNAFHITPDWILFASALNLMGDTMNTNRVPSIRTCPWGQRGVSKFTTNNHPGPPPAGQNQFLLRANLQHCCCNCKSHSLDSG